MVQGVTTISDAATSIAASDGAALRKSHKRGERQKNSIAGRIRIATPVQTPPRTGCARRTRGRHERRAIDGASRSRAAANATVL